MDQADNRLGFLRDLSWNDMLLVLVVLVTSSLLVGLVRRIVRWAAEGAPSHQRLLILRAAPIARLLIGLSSLAIIIPILVEPTFTDIVALLAAVGLALAFALKDYVGCLVAGVVTIFENTYQPGDWIEVDGIYGEVKLIGSRAVHIVTADDTAVTIPHTRLWATGISNASGGQQSLLCVTNFYLQADHDGATVMKALAATAEDSSFRKPGSSIKVVASETPWATHYKLKAYVNESREQFAMITDLTIRGKQKLRAMKVAFAQAPYVASEGH